jgi:hypothetical protein
MGLLTTRFRTPKTELGFAAGYFPIAVFELQRTASHMASGDLKSAFFSAVITTIPTILCGLRVRDAIKSADFQQILREQCAESISKTP